MSPLFLYAGFRCCTVGWFTGLAAPLAVSVNVAIMFVRPAYRVFRAVFLDSFF